jgi:predicted N-acetyltransferase YhbS
MRCSVRVRSAEPADVEELAGLVDDQAGSRPRLATDRLRRFAQLVGQPDRVVLVAEDDVTHAVVGVVIANEGEVGALSPVTAMVVNHLVVHGGHRRRGVGRALLAGVVRSADERGVEHVVVSASTGDRDANRYLARLGFSPMVVRRIASTTTLRRSLGMSDLLTRAGRRRRSLRALRPDGIVSRGA